MSFFVLLELKKIKNL